MMDALSTLDRVCRSRTRRLHRLGATHTAARATTSHAVCPCALLRAASLRYAADMQTHITTISACGIPYMNHTDDPVQPDYKNAECSEDDQLQRPQVQVPGHDKGRATHHVAGQQCSQAAISTTWAYAVSACSMWRLAPSEPLPTAHYDTYTAAQSYADSTPHIHTPRVPEARTQGARGHAVHTSPT